MCNLIVKFPISVFLFYLKLIGSVSSNEININYQLGSKSVVNKDQ